MLHLGVIRRCKSQAYGLHTSGCMIKAEVAGVGERCQPSLGTLANEVAALIIKVAA